MSTPSNVGLFPFAFPGYGPGLSRGLAAVTADGRLVLAEAFGNPGTAVINALDAAVAAARSTFNLSADTGTLYWEPASEDGEALWQVTVDDDGTTLSAADSTDDAQLRGAIRALRTASGFGVTNPA